MLQRSVLLTALILDNPMCLSCIAKHTAMSTEAVQIALTVIERVIAVQREASLCGACGVPGMVCFMERPAQWSGR